MFRKNLPAITNTSRFLTVLLFVYTGISKLLSHDLFFEQLSQVTFLKINAQSVSVFLPIIEIFTGLLIAVNCTEIYGWLLAVVLMTAFTIYIGGMLLLKSKLPCTCGGVIAAMSWQQHFFFNIFFWGLSCFQLWQKCKKK